MLQGAGGGPQQQTGPLTAAFCEEEQKGPGTPLNDLQQAARVCVCVSAWTVTTSAPRGDMRATCQVAPVLTAHPRAARVAFEGRTDRFRSIHFCVLLWLAFYVNKGLQFDNNI